MLHLLKSQNSTARSLHEPSSKTLLLYATSMARRAAPLYCWRRDALLLKFVRRRQRPCTRRYRRLGETVYLAVCRIGSWFLNTIGATGSVSIPRYASTIR